MSPDLSERRAKNEFCKVHCSCPFLINSVVNFLVRYGHRPRDRRTRCFTQRQGSRCLSGRRRSCLSPQGNGVKKVLAVGEDAKLMLGQDPPAHRSDPAPCAKAVIADSNTAEEMKKTLQFTQRCITVDLSSQKIIVSCQQCATPCRETCDPPVGAVCRCTPRRSDCRTDCPPRLCGYADT